MIEDAAERMRLVLTGRELTIPLSQADEMRLRMWIDRFNTEAKRSRWYTGPNDLLDPDDDHAMGIAVVVCMCEGMRADESEHGLEGCPWGEVITKEQADEMRRRSGF